MKTEDEETFPSFTDKGTSADLVLFLDVALVGADKDVVGFDDP